MSPDQGRAIVSLEAGESPAAEPVARRLSIASELITYCGSLLAMMGGAYVVGQSWESMPVVARIAVGVVIATVGFLGGRALHALHESGAERLGGFMWLVGAGGVALATGTSVHEAGVDSPEFIAMSIGAAVLLVGASLWRNLERPLQLLTTVVGLMVLTTSSVSQFGVRPWVAGIVLWIVSVAVGSLAAGERLHPQLFVLILAALGLLAASAMLSDLSEQASALVGLATAAGIVVAALALHRTQVLVLGVLGMLVFLQALFALYFSGPLAAAAVALVGLLVAAVALVRSTRRRTES